MRSIFKDCYRSANKTIATTAKREVTTKEAEEGEGVGEGVGEVVAKVAAPIRKLIK